jgi:hypothetical protein
LIKWFSKKGSNDSEESIDGLHWAFEVLVSFDSVPDRENVFVRVILSHLDKFEVIKGSPRAHSTEELVDISFGHLSLGKIHKGGDIVLVNVDLELGF